MMKSAWAAGAIALASLILAQSATADILVRADGSLVEGKILSQDGKAVVFQADGVDASAAEHLDRAAISRVLLTDDHGGLRTEGGAATKPATPWVVPPEPAAPPVVAHATSAATYYVIPLHGVVGETVLASILEKSLADAVLRKPTVVILDIDSPGGLVAEAKKIISVIHRYNKELRIVAFTDQDLSAAAVVSLSAREIYVKSTSTIGAATSFVPDQTLSPVVQEKMQSAWRAVARNSAEEGGHEPLLAEAMIDNTLALHLETVNGKPVITEGEHGNAKLLCRQGKILTLTSHEAEACGLAAGQADDLVELGKVMKLPNWQECKGLGKLLAEALPKRNEILKVELDKIQARLQQNLQDAIRADPSQATVTVTRTTGGMPQPGRPMMPGMPPRPYPGVPMVPGGPTHTTVTHMRSTSHWKANSLICIVALQQVEANLKDAMSLSTAFGQDQQAEGIKDFLDRMSAVRAQVYDDRNKYGSGVTASPPAPAPRVTAPIASGKPATAPAAAPVPVTPRPAPVAASTPASGAVNTVPVPDSHRRPAIVRRGGGNSLYPDPTQGIQRISANQDAQAPEKTIKTDQLGGHGGQPYVLVAPEARPFYGFHFTFGQWGGKQVMRKVQPIFDPPTAPVLADTGNSIAREGYVVGGLIVDEDEKNIVAVKVIYTRFKDGHLLRTDTYTSDWMGTPDASPTHQLAGNGESVIGVFGRQGLNLDAMGLLTAAP